MERPAKPISAPAAGFAVTILRPTWAAGTRIKVPGLAAKPDQERCHYGRPRLLPRSRADQIPGKPAGRGRGGSRGGRIDLARRARPGAARPPRLSAPTRSPDRLTATGQAGPRPVPSDRDRHGEEARARSPPARGTACGRANALGPDPRPFSPARVAAVRSREANRRRWPAARSRRGLPWRLGGWLDGTAMATGPAGRRRGGGDGDRAELAGCWRPERARGQDQGTRYGARAGSLGSPRGLRAG
jgi:hypothetical protein